VLATICWKPRLTRYQALKQKRESRGRNPTSGQAGGARRRSKEAAKQELATGSRAILDADSGKSIDERGLSKQRPSMLWA